MTPLALIGLFFTLVAIGVFTSLWMHDYYIYRFKKGYIQWVIDHLGAFVIIYLGGMLMLTKDLVLG